ESGRVCGRLRSSARCVGLRLAPAGGFACGGGRGRGARGVPAADVPPARQQAAAQLHRAAGL
ncbi:unnamed protein product, partial [Effrenium voratum]